MYITCASSRYNWLLLPFLVIVSVSLSAQNPQTYIQQSGMPIFTTTQAVELGFINLSNGNLHIEIPLGAFPQRGTMPTFAAKLIYDSRIWGFSDLSGGWKPYNPGSSDGISTVSTNSYCCGGWRFVTSADPGMVNNQSHYEDCNDSQEQINDGFLWTAADGTSHYFPIQTSFHNCPSDPPPDASGGADDGSGYFMKVTNAFTPVVLGPDGTQVYPQIEDTNGNYFSYDANTNVAIDTLGRVPVVVTPNCNGNSSLICYDVLNSAGGRSRYTATFMQIDVCTNFGVSGPDYCPGNPNYPYVPVTVIQSIALPNNTSYTFDYDAGTTPGKFGLLKTVTLPTGGQVGYTHAIFVESSGLRNLWVNSYSSNGNGWTLTPQVTVSCSGLQPCEQQITVTKPTGDKSVYTFGIWTSNGPWNTRIQYQKSDSTLLMDVQNDVPFDKCADQAATYTSTVTVPSQSGPSAVKKTSYAYPMTYSGSDNCWISAKTNPIRKDEYAFGQGVSGPLIRSTAYSYLSDSAYVARNITDRPLSEVVSDGVGNIAAQTQYEYDNYTEGIATTGAPQHDLNYGSGFLIRGNVTATSRWRNTDGAWLTTRNQFDDAGNVRKTTDPGQHVTTLDFTDDWAGSGCVSSNTQAYATMITNALSQQTKKKYYPCTGLTQSMRDQNDINAGRSGTTYTYDVIGRPLVTSLPDGGQTTS